MIDDRIDVEGTKDTSLLSLVMIVYLLRNLVGFRTASITARHANFVFSTFTYEWDGKDWRKFPTQGNTIPYPEEI